MDQQGQIERPQSLEPVVTEHRPIEPEPYEGRQKHGGSGNVEPQLGTLRHMPHFQPQREGQPDRQQAGKHVEHDHDHLLHAAGHERQSVNHLCRGHGVMP